MCIPKPITLNLEYVAGTPLSTRFNFRTPALWFAHAHLVDDYLELTGWQGLRRYHRRIQRTHILHVDVHPPDGLILWLHDGETIRLTVPEPTRWQQALTTVNAPKP